MNIWDIVILAVIAGLVCLAVRRMKNGKGGCGGNCAACKAVCRKNEREDGSQH